MPVCAECGIWHYELAGAICERCLAQTEEEFAALPPDEMARRILRLTGKAETAVNVRRLKKSIIAAKAAGE